MALTPQQIATASQCLTCADSFANEILTLLLARWAGGSTDAQTLATASTPFQGFTGNAADAAFSFMLATINGGSLDPNVASQNATCFSCLDGFQQRAQIYALATITGSSTDPNVLAAAASGFQGIFNQTAVQLYLLSQKSGVSASQLAAAIPCWTCGSGQQDRVQTFFFSVLAGSGPTPPTNCTTFTDTSMSIFTVISNAGPTCLSFPNLNTVTAVMAINTNPNLTSIVFGSALFFSGISPPLGIKSNPILTSITFAGAVTSFNTTGGAATYDFFANALTQSVVDSILAMFDSTGESGNKRLRLTGGTNAAPSAAGLAHAANLVGKGWTVATN